MLCNFPGTTALDTTISSIIYLLGMCICFYFLLIFSLFLSFFFLPLWFILHQNPYSAVEGVSCYLCLCISGCREKTLLIFQLAVYETNGAFISMYTQTGASSYLILEATRVALFAVVRKNLCVKIPELFDSQVFRSAVISTFIVLWVRMESLFLWLW